MNKNTNEHNNTVSTFVQVRGVCTFAGYVLKSVGGGNYMPYVVGGHKGGNYMPYKMGGRKVGGGVYAVGGGDRKGGTGVG
jgi:hypothetical protein